MHKIHIWCDNFLECVKSILIYLCHHFIFGAFLLIDIIVPIYIDILDYILTGLLGYIFIDSSIVGRVL